MWSMRRWFASITHFLLAITLLAVVLFAFSLPVTPVAADRPRPILGVPGASQSTPTPQPEGGITVALGNSAPAANYFVNLPFVTKPAANPAVTIQFASSVDGSGSPVNPTTFFSYGVTRIYFRAALANASGKSFRIDAVFGSQVVTLKSGTISIDPYVYDDGFLSCQPGGVNCGTTPLPRSSYGVRVYIGGVLVAQSTSFVS